MNGNFPPQEGYRHELAYESNTAQECQGLDNANTVLTHKEEVADNGNDGERSGDFSPSIWPPTAQTKGTDKRDGFFSNDFSPDCQGTVTEMAADFGNYSFHQVNQHPVRTNIGHIADDDGERTVAERRERYNFENDRVAAASTSSSQDEELKSGSSSNWMSVIKEALEMSNGIELEPGLSCSTSMVYEEPFPKGVEHVKDHFVSVDYRCPDVHEESKIEVNSAQESSVVVLSDATKISSVKLNQDVQREVDFLMDNSSVNDKVFKKTSYKTLEQCSTLGFCNTTEIHTREQYIPAEHKEVSGVTMRSCLSDELSAVRANIEEQSKNAADIRKNTEGTLLATASQLRDTSKDDQDDSQAKLCEEYCSKGNVTQRPNLEHDSPNIQDNIDQRIWYNCAESETKRKLSTSDDQKPGVSHGGFVPMESSWSSNVIIKGTSERSHVQDLPLKHEHYAEHHSECSTSVTKLENLVHNLYKMVPQGGSLNMTTNAEYTQTKGVVICSAVQDHQKLVKNQKMTNKWDTGTHKKALDPSVLQQSTAEPGDRASGKIPSAKANHHVFEKHDSSEEQMTAKQSRSQQETNNCNTSEFPQQYSLKNVQEKLPFGTSEHVHQNPEKVQSRQKIPRKRKTLDSEVLTGQVQNLTSGSRKTSGYTPKTNVAILSFQKEGLTKGACHTTSVSQRTREKLKKKEKSSGPAKKTSILSEEQLLVMSNAMVPTIKQECDDITLINEDKHEEQTGIKLQTVSQTVSQQEDCLPLVPISDAQGSVKVKSHAKKAKKSQSNDITFIIKEEALSCDISKPLDSLSSLSPQNTTWELKRKNSKIKNKLAPSCSVQKGDVSTDMLSSPDCQFEEINSSPDVQNLEIKKRTRSHSNKDIKRFSAPIKAEGQDFLEQPVYSEGHASSACSVQNTPKKTKNSGIKAPDLQLSLESPSFVTTKEHAKEVNVDAKTPQPVKKKARKLNAHLSAESIDNSFQPEEVRDYLKKLRQRASTSKKEFFVCKTTAENVKLEPDFYPVTCENASDFLKNETVSSSPEPHKDRAPKRTKNEQKMDHLKSIKTQNTLKETEKARIKAPDLQLSLESPTIVTSKEHAKQVNVDEETPQPVKKKAKKLDAHLSGEILPAKILENSFQPEVRDYLKKLRQRTSTSKKDFFVCKTTAKHVKLEPDLYPVTCENASDFLKNAIVSSSPEPHKDHAPKHTKKNEQKMDHLRSVKTHVVRKNRAGHAKKRKLKKLVKSLSTVHETSESITSQDSTSQNPPSKHPVKMEVNSENTQTMHFSRRSCRIRQNNPFSSVQSHSCMSPVLSHTCESPEHEQTILSHPGCTMDTADSETMSSNSAVGSARQKSPRRKSTRTSTTVQTDNVEIENLDSVKQASLIPSKKKSKSYESTVEKPVAPVENDEPPPQVSCLASAENEIGSRTPPTLRKQNPTISNSSTVINVPQAIPAHSKKRKTSKPNFSVLSLRHSRRLSKFNAGKISRRQNSGQSAADERISIRRHSAVSQQVHQMDIKPRKTNKKKVSVKPSKHNKKKAAQNKSNIKHSLRKCHANVKRQKTDKNDSFVYCTQRGRHLNLSNENVRRLKTSIPHKTRNLKSKRIAQEPTTVTATKKLDNRSVAKTRIPHAESHEDNCGPKRRNLRPPPLAGKHEGNAHVRTTFKNKRRWSQKNTGPINKRKPSSSRVNYLQQQSCKSDGSLNNFEGSLKNPIPNEELHLKDVEINSTNDCNKTLLNTETEDADLSSKAMDKEAKGRESKERRGLGDRKNEEGLNTEPNGGTNFELSMQSSINSRGFKSSEICDQKIKEEMSEELVIDGSIRALDLEMLGRDVGVESSCANEDILPQNSGGQNEERLAQSSEDDIAPLSKSSCALEVECSLANEGILQQNSGGQNEEGLARADEDYIAPVGKGTCVAKDVKSKKLVSLPKYSAKNCIVCKYCGQSFRHISAYTIHQRIHTGEKPYRCKLCGKSFAQLSKLKVHRKIHIQPEALCCPCCSKKFSQKNSLLSHFRIHLKESKQNSKPDRDIQRKPSALSTGSLKSSTNHMCIICDSIFPNKFMLKLHMHMHEENPLSCKTCGKEFQKSSQLSAHEKTHWPIKPYACSICGKGFSRLTALKKHSQEHTGETPFSCCHCGHAFRDLSELRLHQVSERCIVKGKLRGDNCDIEGLLVSQGVDGQVNTPVFFKCKICKQTYQKWCQYTLHLETHTKSPPYLCVACGQTYEKNSEVSFHCNVCCQYSGEEVPCNAPLSEIFAADVQKDAFSQNDSTCNLEPLQGSKTKNMPVPSENNSKIKSQTPDNPLQKADVIIQPSEFMEASSSSETVPLVNTDVVLINQHSGLPLPLEMTIVSSNDSLEATNQRNEKYKSLCAHKQPHPPHSKHCGKSFERRSRLGLNQRIHGKRRCYSCLQCNVQFRFFGSYKEHLLNHAGERPFTCPVCPETFVHAESACVHRCKIQQPAKALRCDVCAKTFNNLRNLLKHCLLHKDAASHQCLSCKLSFTNNKILQEHLKTHNNSVDLQLPEVPSKPLAFPHKCMKCKASFSTGDLLYAHQTRHFRGQVYSPNVSESTSSISTRKPHPPPLPSTSRPLVPTLNLDVIPNESLYTYPHPDKLYMMPSLSRRRPQIICLDSEDEENLQPASSSHTSGKISIPDRERSGQTGLERTSVCSETDNSHLPQSSQSPKSPLSQPQSTESMPATCTPSYIKDKASQNSETANFVETIVFIEDPTTTANTEKTQEQSESFECVDCSYKTSSLMGLHEHHFLHALGNRYRDKLSFL